MSFGPTSELLPFCSIFFPHFILVPLPRRGPAYLPLSILLCVSATTICRRNSDGVAARCREYHEARSVRGPKAVLGRFDSPALLARNCFETGHHGCVAGDGCCLHCCSKFDVRNAFSCSAGDSRSNFQDRGHLCLISKSATLLADK